MGSRRTGCDSVINLHLVKDDRAPYYPGDIYNKKDLYQTDKQTFWISAVPNAHLYEWNFTNSGWRTEGRTNDYVLALRNIQDGDTGTVAVRAVNACGTSQWSEFKIGTTGIASYLSGLLKVYPNPTNNLLHVETDASANLVVLFDVSGRELQRVAVTDGKAELSLESYAPGMYILHVRADRRILQTARVVKQ